MTGTDMVEEVKKLGIKTTLKTVQRYEKAGVISSAQRSSGPGFFGREADYPAEAVYQFCASYALVHHYKWKVKFEDVACVREVALRIIETEWSNEELMDYVEQNDDRIDAVWRWILTRLKVQNKRPITFVCGLKCTVNEGQPLQMELISIKDNGGLVVRI